MQKDKISIVIPVYNVEKYLQRCLDSVLKQTYTDIEIILVDDGSTDGCGMICDEYEKTDKRIKVIHKENKGLSDARNVGIDQITGEYLVFIDSDDFVSRYYIENLWRALKQSNAEMAISGFINYYEGDDIPLEKIVEENQIKKMTTQECLKKMFYQDEIDMSAWGKLYKSKMFCDIKYPVGKLNEDILVTYRLVEKSRSIAFIDNIDYMYFQRRDSIQNSTFNLKKMDAIEQMKILRAYIKQNYPQLANAIDCKYFSTLCNVLFQIDDLKYKNIKSEIWSEIKHLRSVIIKDKFARKKAKVGALLSYLGCNGMKRIYLLWKKG